VSRKRTDPHDRDRSTLHPRRELLEALWSLAYFDTNRRRRRAGERRRSILKVEIWCQANQARVIAAYRRHAKYLHDPRPLARRTLTRQMNGFARRRLVIVQDRSRFNRKRGEWIQQANFYTITHAGKLWIKRHARAVQIPLVV
jgi:hypothetical protein